MTGEMSQSEVTAENFPLHFAIAFKLGGTVHAFDQYQGPYVKVKSHKLWVTSDNGASCRIYNDTTQRESTSFYAFGKDAKRLAVEAAQDTMDTSKRKFEVTVRRVVREDLTLTVWAINANEAREAAGLEAVNRDGWEGYDCEYSTDASEVKEVTP